MRHPRNDVRIIFDSATESCPQHGTPCRTWALRRCVSRRKGEAADIHKYPLTYYYFGHSMYMHCRKMHRVPAPHLPDSRQLPMGRRQSVDIVVLIGQ